jgi:hypothetical protein
MKWRSRSPNGIGGLPLQGPRKDGHGGQSTGLGNPLKRIPQRYERVFVSIELAAVS